MFTSNFKEKTSNEAMIKNVSPEAFHEFLRFIYTNSVNDIKKHVDELFAVADLYDVKGLKIICEAQLLKDLNEENANAVFQLAHLHNSEKSLQKAAFKLIKQ